MELEVTGVVIISGHGNGVLVFEEGVFNCSICGDKYKALFPIIILLDQGY